MSDQSKIETKYILELNKGSYTAFNALYELYSKRLYSYVFKLTKSHEDTQDIVQDTFVKLWTNRHHVHANDSFQSYLFTISKNTLLNKVRAVINETAFADYLTYINKQNTSKNNVSELLDFKDFKRILSDAKQSLSHTQLKVFELSKEVGYSNKEIAQQLNLSEQTIKNQLSLALKKIHTFFEHNPLLFIIFLSFSSH